MKNKYLISCAGFCVIIYLFVLLAGCGASGAGSGGSATATLLPPVISPGTTRYAESQTISISASDGADVYYTNDGSWFSNTADAIFYTAPFSISEPTVILARAYSASPGFSNYTRADYAITPATNPELTVNGNFSYGLACWGFWADTGTSAAADFTAENGYLRTTISEPGSNNWSISTFYRARFNLDQGEYYKVVFDARSNPVRIIEVEVQEEGYDNDGDGSSYTCHSGTRSFELTSSFQTFSFIFEMEDLTNPHASIRFMFGDSATGSVDIDNISFLEYTPAALNEADIPDPQLRAAITDAAGKTSFNEVTDVDTASLEELDIDNNVYAVTNLEGIELLTGLRELKIL